MDPIDRYAELLADEDRAVVVIRRAVHEGASIKPGMAQLAAAVAARLAFVEAQGWTEDAEDDAAVDALEREGAEAAS